MINKLKPSNLKEEEWEEDKDFIWNIIKRYNLKNANGSFNTEFTTFVTILQDTYEIGARNFHHPPKWTR